MEVLSDIYIYTFFTLSIILTSLIGKKIVEKVFPLREGLDIGKSMSRALAKPVSKLKKTGDKAVGGINKVAGGITKVFKYIEKIAKFLGAVFVSIGSYLECSVFYIKNIFSYCIIYYILYITGLIIYAPFALLFWATGTQAIEKEIWKIMETINEFFVDVSGFNVLDYIYPAKCYKCNLKPMPKLKL
jgi:hypothetical protein